MPRIEKHEHFKARPTIGEHLRNNEHKAEREKCPELFVLFAFLFLLVLFKLLGW